MADLKFIFVLSCVFALVGLSQVKAASKFKREVEQAPEQNQMEKVSQQLVVAFDSLKKSMEELTSKFNTEDIVQGFQNFTAKLENYAKQAADQFASTASGNATLERKGDFDQPQPAAP